jgi:PilZ domain
MTDGVRKHPRVDQNIDLVWAIETRQVSGRGKIVNLSLSGACIRVDLAFAGDKTVILSLICPSIPKLPTKVKLQWVRRVAGAQPHVLIGVAFTQQQNEVEWTKWFEANGGSTPAQGPQLTASGGRR